MMTLKGQQGSRRPYCKLSAFSISSERESRFGTGSRTFDLELDLELGLDLEPDLECDLGSKLDLELDPTFR